MRGRHDWNRLLRHVDPKTQTGLVNIWEPIAQEFHWFVGDIKKNALRPGAFDLGVNRSSHNIPRCERTASIVAFHEIDRKSTRLNSSHSQISYAVFCLKKKKKATHTLQYLLCQFAPRT